MYDRFNTLSALCKTARKRDQNLKTKVIYGADDLVLMEKHVGDPRYLLQSINKYGDLPPFNLDLIWPSQIQDIPIFTPPKGRIKKRNPSSPRSSPGSIRPKIKNPDN